MTSRIQTEGRPLFPDAVSLIRTGENLSLARRKTGRGAVTKTASQMSPWYHLGRVDDTCPRRQILVNSQREISDHVLLKAVLAQFMAQVLEEIRRDLQQRLHLPAPSFHAVYSSFCAQISPKLTYRRYHCVRVKVILPIFIL